MSIERCFRIDIADKENPVDLKITGEAGKRKHTLDIKSKVECDYIGESANGDSCYLLIFDEKRENSPMNKSIMISITPECNLNIHHQSDYRKVEFKEISKEDYLNLLNLLN